MDLEAEIAKLLQQDPLWGDVIRTCVDWATDKGREVEFERTMIYHRMGHIDGRGPRLTPLEQAGILRKSSTTSEGTPVYVLNEDPRVLLDALAYARTRTGVRRT